MGEKERDREKREGEDKEGKEEGGKREGQREGNTALHSSVLKPWASLQRVYLTGSLEKKMSACHSGGIDVRILSRF